MSELNNGTLYCEAIIEHAEDGFRYKFSECEGTFKIEYQEWVNKETGNPESNYGNHEWKTKSEFVGLWTAEVDKVCQALQLVAAQANN